MGHGRQPRARVVWRAFAFPLRRGGGECFLQRFFSRVERARDTDQRGDNSSILFAKNLFECGRRTHTRIKPQKDTKSTKGLIENLCALGAFVGLKLSRSFDSHLD